MISAQLYATDVGEKVSLFKPSNLVPPYYEYIGILNNYPIFNYAAFFKEGINLYDNELCIGDENDYYGYIGNLQSIEIWSFNSGDVISVSNGVTVIFDRYSCNKIEIYVKENWEDEYIFVTSVENENGLPKETYINVEGEVVGVDIKLVFSGYPENAYVTLKGLVLGKIIEIDNFFSYNSIAEIRPLGDDLPMNEINFETLLTDEFFDEQNQKLKIYDGLVLYENDFLVSSNKKNKKRYVIKSRNEVKLLDKDDSVAYYRYEYISDWNNIELFASDVLDELYENIEYPDWFKTYRINPFVKTQSKRKILQQIAWATCCGVDTTYSDKIKLAPYLATENTTPDIVINNADGRTKSLELIKGEKYSVVKCKIPSYTKKAEIETLGKITPYYSSDMEYRYSFNLDEPFNVYETGTGNSIVKFKNPYFVAFENENGGEQTVTGYKYDKVDKTLEIATSNFGSVFEISNQEVYPLDMTEKEKQIKKWYSNNNTIKATLVNNEDLKVGRVLKIQLENGKYFQGIIIKTERNNIADKHLIDLEAHEWN